VPERKQTKAPPTMAEAEIAIVRIAPETSFKNKAYEALKEAILKMDIYATPEPVMLDERALSERLGVSRTPIREAIAMLEQDGFVKTVPRRGIVVVRRTKTEIVDMIRAWAALESMAARLITTTARKKDISALRDFFRDFGKDRLPQDHVEEYSKANIAFHQPRCPSISPSSRRSKSAIPSLRKSARATTRSALRPMSRRMARSFSSRC
jgi:DNA-binding GntR family transcriptional regulator